MARVVFPKASKGGTKLLFSCAASELLGLPAETFTTDRKAASCVSINDRHTNRALQGNS